MLANKHQMTGNILLQSYLVPIVCGALFDF